MWISTLFRRPAIYLLPWVCLLGQPVLAQDDGTATADVAPAGAEGRRQVNRSMFPGFRYSQEEIYTYEDPDALPGDLPFEAEVRRRNRRIDLGLDRPQRSTEPVDNVLNFKF